MKRGLEFGYIGLGQCGGNIANKYAMLGYDAVAINTSSTDLKGLSKIKETHKLLIKDKEEIEGAGKNPDIGEKILTNEIDTVVDFIKAIFNKKYSKIFLCLGLGGGSGCGMVEILSQVLNEFGYEIGVIATLPNEVEPARVKLVALSTYEKIANLSCVTNIFLVDNEKVSKRIPGISLKAKYEFLNTCVAEQIDNINILSQRPSTITSFDAKDLETVLSPRGISIINEVTIDDVDKIKEEVYLTRLFSDSINLSIGADIDSDKLECSAAVFLFDLPKNTGKNIKEKSLQLLQNKVGNPFDVFYGIYESERTNKKGTFTVLLTGIDVSSVKRIQDMSKDFEEKAGEYEKKFNRNNNVNYSNNKTDMLSKFSFNKNKQNTSEVVKKEGKSILDKIKEKNK